MNQDDKQLFIVFNIDTEGPATESLQHVFFRVKNIFGISLEPTPQNFARIQKGDLPNIDDETRLGLRTMFSPERMAYLNNWEEVGEMLSRVFSQEARTKLKDSFGNGYVYNFFATDLVGHVYNPRRKPIGYHQVYDFYREAIDKHQTSDPIHWHYHGPGFVRHAYLDVFNLSNTDHHVQILSRRILDRMYFPACFRPGMDLIRPDHNFFLEQWIPFDYSNQGAEPSEIELSQKDNEPGRFGDWRRAPQEWTIYNPDYFDYQNPGHMKRYVARCLYTKGRFRPMTQQEADRGFARAASGKRTIISFMCHDSRDLQHDMDAVNPLLKKAADQHPEVKFRHCNAIDAMRMALKLPFAEPAQLQLRWCGNRFEIASDKSLWGPQPFFCFRTWDFRYYHDNLDKQNETEWSYTFDWQTVDRRAIAKIGIATNDDFGNTTVAVWDAETEQVEVRYLNAPVLPELLA